MTLHCSPNCALSKTNVNQAVFHSRRGRARPPVGGARCAEAGVDFQRREGGGEGGAVDMGVDITPPILLLLEAEVSDEWMREGGSGCVHESTRRIWDGGREEVKNYPMPYDPPCDALYL